MLLGVKAGDIMWYWYFKTDKGVSINPKEISILKYKEMLMTTVKDVRGILGYGSTEKRKNYGFLVLTRTKSKDIDARKSSIK